MEFPISHALKSRILHLPGSTESLRFSSPQGGSGIPCPPDKSRARQGHGCSPGAKKNENFHVSSKTFSADKNSPKLNLKTNQGQNRNNI